MARCECTNYNPCECGPAPNSCVIDPCVDCLRVASPIILPDDSVGPCGQSGFVNLKPLNNYSICGDNAEMFHKIVKYDQTAFTNVYIDDTNGKLELRFTTTDAAKINTPYYIFYKAACKGKNRSDIGVITVFIKDECAYANCNNCNPCNGECDGAVDLTVDIEPSNIQIEIV